MFEIIIKVYNDSRSNKVGMINFGWIKYYDIIKNVYEFCMLFII